MRHRITFVAFIASAALLAPAGLTEVRGLGLPPEPPEGAGFGDSDPSVRYRDRGPGPDTGPLIPRFFTWDEPLGNAAEDPRIIEMVRKITSQPPAEAADSVCDEILLRGLRPGEIAVALQKFGMGDGDPADLETGLVALWRNWQDSVGSDQAEQWWMTSWMSAGVVESHWWMSTFIARYHERQAADPALPDPDRFHFDTERPIVPHFASWQVVEAFDVMRSDPRWDSEVILGNGGLTLGQLYVQAGLPTYDPTKSWSHVSNRPWSLWYTPICYQAMEAAMDAAAYHPIRQAWPDCRSSNYSTSAGYDGLGDPARLRLMSGGQLDWYELAYQHRGDLRAPVCYWAHDNFTHPGETLQEASVRLSEIIVERCINSFDGDPSRVVPWIQLCGNQTVGAEGEIREVTEMQMFETLCMLKDKGVTEVIVWNNDSAQTEARWNAFASFVDTLWGIGGRPAEVLGVAEVGTGDTQLFRLNVVTGDFTLTGPVHAALDLKGMTAAGDSVIGISGGAGGPHDLVDIASGQVTVIVPDLDLGGDDAEVTAMTADATGVIWAFIANRGFATIDPAGNVTVEVESTLDIQGLAASDDGTAVWGITRNGVLYRVDVAGGTITQADHVSDFVLGETFENLRRVSDDELAFITSVGSSLKYWVYTISTGVLDTTVYAGLGPLKVECLVLAPPQECPDEAPLPLIGACCLADGACLDVPEPACADLGGVYHGWNVQCLELESACPLPCEADVDDDGTVGATDLVAVIASWDSDDAAADVDGNGVVGTADLVMVIGDWGPCP